MNQTEKNRLDEMEVRVEQMEQSLQRILFYFDSDHKTNTKGIIERFDILEQKLDQLLSREAVYLAKAKTAGAIWGAVVGFVVLFAKMIFDAITNK